MKNFKFDISGRTLVCGILNITPDSFSDGGLWDEPKKALERACEMQAQGADIIDVGAQSTRPGAQLLSAWEEKKRLVPVLELLREKITVPISVDTFYPKCAETALENGASIINDVSGQVSDDMARVVSSWGAGWIIMHNPADANTDMVYDKGVVEAVSNFFLSAANKAESFGIPRESLCFDIGVGFAKNYEDNLKLIKEIGRTRVEGSALMSAVSRKRVIGIASGEQVAAKRDAGTVAAHTASILGGADIIRVHDVFSAVQAARVADAIKSI
ncbi:MAG: dihydropteroate synthase [Clostridia bacterium]|nr:dihydropteroate synthase [Clostridia bacterium]